MSSKKETLGGIVSVALALCVVCSIVVSAAAVVLKPAQEVNKTRDLKRNILMAAGLYDPALTIEEQFQRVDSRVVDVSTGEYATDIDPEGFDQRAAAKDPATSVALDSDADIANIIRQSRYAMVYLVNDEAGELSKVILPVHGYGLWSTLYGFVALESDGNTIAGLGFYEHKETPGLGGEVDNPRWKDLWKGKQVYRDGAVAISVVKGSVDQGSDVANWQVDGLSGATLTSRGVSNLVQYWLGADGFEPYLRNLREGDA